MPPNPVMLLLAVSLAASPRTARGPTVATEDTLHTEVPEVLVNAPRVTLDEILDRVARGEAHRDSLLADQAFTATVRLVRMRHAGGPQELSFERVAKLVHAGNRSVEIGAVGCFSSNGLVERGIEALVDRVHGLETGASQCLVELFLDHLYAFDDRL